MTMTTTNCIVPNGTSTAHRSTKKRAFPFTTIIVTNPDEASARSAQELLDSTLQRYLHDSHRYTNSKNIQIISTYDPFGARCGSFGGTLAALDLIQDKDAAIPQTVLCLHAGGDSSRCPLSMILGKAWTNLPSEDYRNPIAWLIHQLEDLFDKARIPPGSLVVTATDCLISLGDPQEEQTTSEQAPSQSDEVGSPEQVVDPFTVLGVAVPAPLNTAKNHGVYVMPETTLPEHSKAEKGSSNNIFQIETPVDVWQKPSVQQMVQGDPPASSSSPTKRTSIAHPACFEVPHRAGKQAWIDVGIVIFFPRAFDTLRKLSDGLLSRCTRKGLQAAYQEADTDLSLESFAKSQALKVDLYTDILHNLPLGESRSMPDELSGEESFHDSLRKVLSALPLRVLVVPQGSFLHLGTTRELIEFSTTTPTTTTKTETNTTMPPIMDQLVTQNLAKALRLNPRFETLPAPIIDNKVNTTLCSTFPLESNQTKLGSSTFVEYSDLQRYESVTIGNHCMLSGWRRKDPLFFMGDTLVEKDLHIPDGMSVQLLPLASKIPEPTNNDSNEDLQETKEQWVMMALGTTDSIKSAIAEAELYGVRFVDFVERTGIAPEELGFGANITEENNLWTAKIHPIVQTTSDHGISFSSFFGWLDQLRTNDASLQSDASFSNWRSAERVSLKDIHGISDASKEWNFRIELETKIWRLKCQSHIDTITSLLKNRCQTVPCDLSWLVELGKHSSEESPTSSFAALSALVGALEDLALAEFAQTNYDVSGRALMLASAAIADFPPQLLVGADDTDDDGDQPLGMNHDRNIPTDRMSFVRNIFGVRKSPMWHPTAESMSICSEKLERLALSMIESTITAGFQKYLVDDSVENDNGNPPPTQIVGMKRTTDPIVDKFVLSVAPVRVDLAGGWSDTPPITYEYGGSVTGMAVLVDGSFPLSCRCRLVSGRTGIFLKTELRDISNGSLLSDRQQQVTDLSQLSDFRDPSASCALLKAALVCLGMVTEEEIRLAADDLQELINRFCSRSEEETVRIEIVSTSLLGMGTGMGTSSILGACVLQSLAMCVGIGKLSDECLIHSVLVLEQLLSSGGGWQDQAHGILPGIKTVTSAPKIPLEIKIDPIVLSTPELSSLQNKLMFAYTGKTRLAKNILQKVLRRWARRTDEIVETVEGLVDRSKAVRIALMTKSWDELGKYMYQAYQLKCVMAGEDSGAEPASVELFVSEMMEHDQIRGAMLCGAGGGGFLLLLLSDNADRSSVERTFETSIAPLSEDFADYRFHDCSIAQSGLTTTILENESESKLLDQDSYKLSWQQSSEQSE